MNGGHGPFCCIMDVIHSLSNVVVVLQSERFKGDDDGVDRRSWSKEKSEQDTD